MTTMTLIVPVYNEEDSIRSFYDAVEPVMSSLPVEWTVLFVNDGSKDKTADMIKKLHTEKPNIKFLDFSRNFGKEAALTAGLEWADADAVVPMDVDLQDPPELIKDFFEKWQQGFDVVLGQRVTRDADTKAKKASAGMFYKIFNAISHHKIEPNVGDFRLMTRRVVTETLRLRERNRFMKGLFAWVGFKTTIVPYSRPNREVGETKFNYWKLWNFALDGITSFSTAPLRVWTYIGGSLALAAIIYMLVTIVSTLLYGNDTPGYTSLMSVVLLLGATQLISLGVIGEYLGRLYMEVKQRPIYIVKETCGFEPDGQAND